MPSHDSGKRQDAVLRTNSDPTDDAEDDETLWGVGYRRRGVEPCRDDTMFYDDDPFPIGGVSLNEWLGLVFSWVLASSMRTW